MKFVVDRIEDRIATLVADHAGFNVSARRLPKGTKEGDHFKLVRDDKSRDAEREKARELIKELVES